jgi:hypothetical protein
MSGRWGRRLRRIVEDIRNRRHLEAYSAFLVVLVLALVNAFGELSDDLIDGAILGALAFLIFWTTGVPTERPRAVLDSVLHDRESLGSFHELLANAHELWIYAPTGVNLLPRHSADIKRLLLEQGGTARVVVQDPSSPMLSTVREQLDSSTDFDASLSVSVSTLALLGSSGGLQYRLLPFSPGFSLVVVDPRRRSGRVIVELHGFRDESISDRMHLEIPRSHSPHWFEYWVGRFEAIWEAALDPAAKKQA